MSANQCQAPNCEKPVSQEGHKLCLGCWRQLKSGALVERSGRFVAAPRGQASAKPPAASAVKASTGQLTSTQLGKKLGLSSAKVNLILAELGWIEKFTKGWKPTSHGEKLGGVERVWPQTGAPYVLWPNNIQENKAFVAVVRELGGVSESEAKPKSATPVSGKPHVEDVRKHFDANYRAMDGHYVRSRAELAIDNWLYMQGIVHAYEKKLPVEEDALCDFYLPESRVYIEFWGMENDANYAARKTTKQAIYAKHELNLVELSDAELENLDDNLARLLLKFGVKTKI